MAFCPTCGSQLPEGAETCPSCGNPLPSYHMPQPYLIQDPTDHTAEFKAEDIQNNKLYGMAAYLLGPIGILMVFLVAKESPFAMFHARQSLKISLCDVLLFVCLIIPILGWIAAPVGWIILFVIRLILFFQTANGHAKDAPIVSGLGFLK